MGLGRTISLCLALLLTGCGSDVRAQILSGVIDVEAGQTQAATPVINPSSGTVPLTVSMSDATSPCNGSIVYNTTGATSGGNLTGTTAYSGSFTASVAATYYAQVQGCLGHTNSGIGTATYTSGGCSLPSGLTSDWKVVNSGSATTLVDSIAANNATSSGGGTPTYTANVIGTNPGLAFNGSSNFMTLGSSISASTATLTWYVVWQSSGSGNGAFFGNATSGAFQPFQFGGTIVYIDAGGVFTNSSTTYTGGHNFATIFTYTLSSALGTIYDASGGTATSVGSGTLGTASQPITIFGNAGAFGYFPSTIVEMGWGTSGSVSPSQIATYTYCQYPTI